ncbi:hypothetical protein LX99_04227 [Mucilaginibacter oryzae]|uniref:Uncharacterized protein n=1 Tax=Mucilaginibacter oryzae TaxID=468058 RepID=A0A316H194_9SPHI|nr:hypothetical protein [Mucilaginibacter oryzae]PWK72897.1 hypothetical protein LX99_04227 [Mucilaginibacter oryzae]
MIRKPHNLVTAYWDDLIYFLNEAENTPKRVVEGNLTVSFPSDKRGIRYTILSAFLFLEAFINAEFLDQMGLSAKTSEISEFQKHILDQQLIETLFEDKWSKWLNLISPMNKEKLKGDKPFQDLMKLKDWRNHLTHYKLHQLFLVAKEIETIENAREACAIAIQAISFYYQVTGLAPSEWVSRDILNRLKSKKK